MQQGILIGSAAGIASAVMVASATFGVAGGRMDARFFLYFLAPLPGFLAGLGWGPASAVAAVMASCLGVGLLRGFNTGLAILVSQGIPVIAICYLAQLNRTVSARSGLPMTGRSTAPERSPPEMSQTIEWYPLGRLVAICVVLAGTIAFLSVLLFGLDIDSIRALIRKLVETVFVQQIPGLKDRRVEEPELQALTEITLYAFPATMALTWLGTFLLNLYLAGRLTLASGRLPRPWPELSAIHYPTGFGLGLAVALTLAVVLDGFPALLASGFAGAMLLGYLLLGLAILHDVSRGRPARTPMLLGIYIGLFVLNPWAGLLVALLGLLEPLLPFRRSRREQSPPN